jgi:lipopolysaccharide export LptBFGC system permease protein LptF
VLKNLVQEFGSIGSPTYSQQIGDTRRMHLYVDRINGDELQGVTVALSDNNEIIQTIMADSARLKYQPVKDDPRKKYLTIILKTGTVKRINPARPSRISIVPLQISGDQDNLMPYLFDAPDTTGNDPSYNSTAQNQAEAKKLRAEIQKTLQKQNGGTLSDDDNDTIARNRKNLNEVLIEIYGRLALATSCFFLALVTVPLSIIIKRGHMIIAFLISLMLVVVYMITFLVGSKFLGMGGYMHPGIAVWLPNIALLFAGAWLLRKVFRA